MPFKNLSGTRKHNDVHAEIRGSAILMNPAVVAQLSTSPVRLVVPHLYFWKSAKWLQSIEFLAEDAPGYWEVRGYHNRGDPWAEQRYSGD